MISLSIYGLLWVKQYQDKYNPHRAPSNGISIGSGIQIGVTIKVEIMVYTWDPDVSRGMSMWLLESNKWIPIICDETEIGSCWWEIP